MTSRSSGRVITFYSYKGGTGRSMALANVAWILASGGKRVLAIDWDLEAPGLHRYFAPFLEDRELEHTDGLIDLIYQYLVATTRDGSTAPHWYAELADLRSCAEPVRWTFPDNGCLEFVGAGRQTSSYGERVNGLDWTEFYRTFGGGAFLDAMFDRAREDYDYVLIDSRTGVADTAGICSVHLPDTLAVFFTLNNQSIAGAAEVARTAQRRRQDENRPLRVFPVTTRVEKAEKDRLDARRRYAEKMFEGLPAHLTPDRRRQYVSRMEVLYEPYYAYEEVLAAFVDTGSRDHSLLATMTWLCGVLSDGEVRQMPLISEQQRTSALALYSAIPTSLDRCAAIRSRCDVFITARSQDRESAAALYSQLRGRCEVFWAETSIRPGDEWANVVETALIGCRVHVVMLSGAMGTSDSHYQHEIETGIRRAKIGDEAMRVLPVYLDSEATNVAVKLFDELALFSPFRLVSERDGLALARLVLESLGIADQPGDELVELRSLRERLYTEISRGEAQIAELKATLQHSESSRAEQEAKLARRKAAGQKYAWALVGLAVVFAISAAYAGWLITSHAERTVELEDGLASAEHRVETAEEQAGAAEARAAAAGVESLSALIDATFEAVRNTEPRQRVLPQSETVQTPDKAAQFMRLEVAERQNREFQDRIVSIKNLVNKANLSRNENARLTGSLQTLQDRLADNLESVQAQKKILEEPTGRSDRDEAERRWREAQEKLSEDRSEAADLLNEAIAADASYYPALVSLAGLKVKEAQQAISGSVVRGDAIKAAQEYLSRIGVEEMHSAAYAPFFATQAQLALVQNQRDAAQAALATALSYDPDLPDALDAKERVEARGSVNPTARWVWQIASDRELPSSLQSRDEAAKRAGKIPEAVFKIFKRGQYYALTIGAWETSEEARSDGEQVAQILRQGRILRDLSSWCPAQSADSNGVISCQGRSE